MQWRIKIHRQIENWGWYDDANTFRVFFHLLILASHWEQNFKGQTLYPWQCCIGRKYLSHKLKLTEQQIRRTIFNLQRTNEIAVKTTNKYSIITICKWEEYQSTEKKQPTKQPTNDTKLNQQTTTTKEYNNKEYNILLLAELEDVIKQRNWQPEFLKLPKTIKTTQAIKDTRCTRRQEYTLEEVKMSINAYLINIKNRVDDGKWFFHHRFTFYDFIKQSNWLQKFINNQPQW